MLAGARGSVSYPTLCDIRPQEVRRAASVDRSIGGRQHVQLMRSRSAPGRSALSAVRSTSSTPSRRFPIPLTRSCGRPARRPRGRRVPPARQRIGVRPPGAPASAPGDAVGPSSAVPAAASPAAALPGGASAAVLPASASAAPPAVPRAGRSAAPSGAAVLSTSSAAVPAVLATAAAVSPAATAAGPGQRLRAASSAVCPAGPAAESVFAARAALFPAAAGPAALAATAVLPTTAVLAASPVLAAAAPAPGGAVPATGRSNGPVLARPAIGPPRSGSALRTTASAASAAVRPTAGGPAGPAGAPPRRAAELAAATGLRSTLDRADPVRTAGRGLLAGGVREDRCLAGSAAAARTAAASTA